MSFLVGVLVGILLQSSIVLAFEDDAHPLIRCMPFVISILVVLGTIILMIRG